jgi:hypothetical protein
MLAACTAKEPTVVYRTQEVVIETMIPCEPPIVSQVEGPDLAPRESSYYEVVQYLVARIYALRSWGERLVNALSACKQVEE